MHYIAWCTNEVAGWSSLGGEVNVGKQHFANRQNRRVHDHRPW